MDLISEYKPKKKYPSPRKYYINSQSDMVQIYISSDFKHKFTQILVLISQAKNEQLLKNEERKKNKRHIISEEPVL